MGGADQSQFTRYGAHCWSPSSKLSPELLLRQGARRASIPLPCSIFSLSLIRSASLTCGTYTLSVGNCKSGSCCDFFITR